MASIARLSEDDLRWMCCRCSRPLEVGPVELTYLGNSFTLELPRCPDCGLYLIPEELATGRMAEVEQILEDK
ncbi:MAG: DNA-binding protein [Actinobacteria bacterium]|nr:DNA-binding protein [Actinomycetota bacterium]